MGSKGGVAITVRRGLEDAVVDSGQDGLGRFAWVKVKVEDEIIGILNVYAPNKNRERKELWNQLQVELDQ